MIKTVKLASYELRRFKGPVPIVALLFLLLVPTLYGALYLWSNWDPYGKLDQVPVAVVNEDVPVTVDGKTVDAGDRLVAELKSDPIFDWQFVDADQAAAGLADGSYYLTITIPSDFSKNLASGASENPSRAVVMLHRDDANGYVIGLLTASVQNQLEAAIDRAAVGAYFESVFANLDTIRTDLSKAATGAAKLATGADASLAGAKDLQKGITTAKDGSAQLVSGLATAKSGSTQLVTGTSDAKAGSASLVTGLTSLESGASELVPAAQQVADGNQQLATTAVPVLNALSAALPSLGQAGANITAATTDVSDLVTVSLNAQVKAAQNQLTALEKANPTLNTDALSTELGNIATTAGDLTTAAGQATQAASAVNTAADSVTGAGDISGAASNLTALATGSAQVATGVSSLSTGISTASSGAGTLDSGIGELSTGATALDSGIGNLQLGAQKLDDGMGTLATGSDKLVKGLTDLDKGMNQLSKDLSAGAARIPTLAPGQQADAEQVLSSPADVQVHIDNPANFYGRGLAPFFFAIAIWVFGISVFLVMRPISGRALAGRAPSARISLAGWLPVFGLAGLGSLLLLGIVWLGLGLNPVNVGGSIGVVLLAAACFTAIAHLLRTWLGVVGSAITLVLLMVQLTSAGGLYPVETLPAPFRAIHSFIPMTYVIDALRITFTGGPTDHLWRDVGILAGFALAAILLCWFVVHRKRRFSVRDLHPVML